MISRDNVVSLSGQKLGGQRMTLDSQSTAAVADCRLILGESLRRLLQAMFDRLDDALYETADKAESHNVQFRYLDAMRDMRKQRPSIETVFLGQALDRYDEFWRTGGLERRAGATGSAEPGELSLVGEDELEETLAINALVSKGESRFERQLSAIKQRFGRVVGRTEMGDEDNPLGPAVLADCFRKAIGELQVELAVRLVIFKLFDRQLVSHLGALYDDVNARFEKAGILANLNVKMRRQQPTTTVGGLTMPAVDPYAEPLPEGAELVGMLSNLLRGQRAASPLPMLSLPVVPTPDLLGALSTLQQTTLQEGPPMLFDFILDDRNLPDAMKALLSRLQIPMIKLAIVDRAFFGKKNHPARRLLNNLAKAGTGWIDDGDRSPKSLYGRVEAVVEKVLGEFDTDPKAFEVANSEFEPFLETEQRGAAVAEERIRQVSRGQEQLKVARSRAAARGRGEPELEEVRRRGRPAGVERHAEGHADRAPGAAVGDPAPARRDQGRLGDDLVRHAPLERAHEGAAVVPHRLPARQRAARARGRAARGRAAAGGARDEGGRGPRRRVQRPGPQLGGRHLA
ncbi:MAG: DUF1631 domain-containing protein, partial [Chromatiaceae bacterium]|nr:DUF1631 domain-containing protein [Chromatiaceae bacterium]